VRVIAGIGPCFTEEEAAARLGTSRWTLQRARQRGEISYFLIGIRQIVYAEAHLDEYLAGAERRRAPAA
jgi:excisionase family DNA binding protein